MSKNFVKRISCPCCESNSYKIIHSVKYSDEKIWSFLNSYYEGKVQKTIIESDYFNVAKCNDCKLLFQEYILNNSNMFLLYEEWISAEKSLSKKNFADINLFKNYSWEVEGICKLFNKKPHEIDVLEYGMGWGFWSNLAKAFNYNVNGYEISKTRIDFAKQRGLQVIEDISKEKSNRYHYIYSNQVFEHIPNPKKTAQDLARILKKNGIFHVLVPNARGIERKLKNPNWKAQKDAIQPLEHINCFNRNSLKVLASEAGLSLRSPLYYPKIAGVKALIKSHLRYFYDLYWSTQVYLTKA